MSRPTDYELRYLRERLDHIRWALEEADDGEFAQLDDDAKPHRALQLLIERTEEWLDDRREERGYGYD